MAQEYFINSQELEDQVRKLLPSQGGAGAGFDLSASTQIIPIIDLTASAEGSDLRADLQSALSFDTVTAFNITGSVTTTVINTTGYWRLFGSVNTRSTDARLARFSLNDGSTDKIIADYVTFGTSGSSPLIIPFDFVVKLDAGDSLKLQTQQTITSIVGCYKQLASIDGTLS